ncbi:MAG: tetratricopeptide repeat protein [Planctomycetaceae bacterium]|nr:tetratricopeptide repeat protein [Planctomycetaceae bacterium]
MIRHSHSAFFVFLRDAKITAVVFALLLMCVGTECAIAQSSGQAFQAGMTFYDTKNYAGAISTWENLLVNDPNYPDKDKVWYYIADAVLRSNMGNEKAVFYLDKIISQKDAQGNLVQGFYYEQSLFLIGQTLYSSAEQLLESGDPIEAKKYALGAKESFDLLLKEIPNSSNVPQALFFQTSIAVKYLQSVTETHKYAELALARIPNDASESNRKMWADCRFYYAWALGQLGQETQARKIFGEFIAAGDPVRGPMSLYELAFTFYRTGDFQSTLNELNSFKSQFPNDTTAALNVQRLQARCHYRMENYTTAAELIQDVVLQQDEKNVPVEDYVYLVLCYIKNKDFEKADKFITWLEQRYANSAYTDGISLLRAHYNAERGQYQNAIHLITPIVGMSQAYPNGPVTFTKRPFNTEDAGAVKCGLSEEHFLWAASLLAICYAHFGQRDTAMQISNAMMQVSNEMYGRYSSIRIRTNNQLSQIAQSPPPPPTTGSGTPPVTGGVPPQYGTGTSGNPSWSSPGTSVIQPGGNNSLANRPLPPEEQDALLNLLRSRADNPEENEGYVNEVISDLHQLLKNSDLSDFNRARAAVLRGNLLYKKKDISQAVIMFEMAYEYIPPDSPYRNTETFEQAAFRLGQNAQINGNYTKAAEYYDEALRTTAGQSDEYRSGLMYRLGSSLMLVPGKRIDGLRYFLKIYEEEKSSDYWSHAALQVAINDFDMYKFDLCEEIIDELIDLKPDKAILDRVLYLKGELAMRNNQWDIAVSSFEAISIYAPDSPFVGTAKLKLSDARTQRRQTIR